MEFRLDQPDTVQCVECGRTRSNGGWSHDPPPRGRVVSHTICPSCQPAMLDHLRWDIEFPSWSFEKQLEAIRLRVRHIPMDAASVREKLRTMGIDDGAVLLRFMEELQPFLVERLCHYCRLPIESSDPISERAGYILHEACAANLAESLHLLTGMEPPQAHLDAYMDVARIPHGVRAGVRKDIESTFLAV
jgi:hypothetical protein